jgi:hypothetical protein
METKLGLIGGEGRIEPVRPMDAAPVHDHHNLLLRMAEDRHHLMNILAQLLGIKVRHDFIEDLRGAILHGANNVQQDAAADPAPGAMLRPDLPLERFLPFDEAGAQRAGGQAIALRAARPPAMEEGKTPHDRLICVEQDDLATPRLILQRSQVARALGELGGLGIEAARGTTIAQRVFFKAPRMLSRPRWIPV